MPTSQQSWVRSQHPPNTVESEGRQMKQCWRQYIEKNSKKSPLLKDITQFKLPMLSLCMYSYFCCKGLYMQTCTLHVHVHLEQGLITTAIKMASACEPPSVLLRGIHHSASLSASAWKISPIHPTCGNLHPAQRAKPAFSEWKPSFANYLEISFFQAFSNTDFSTSCQANLPTSLAMARLPVTRIYPNKYFIPVMD
jgi:hypothetical protein